MYKYVIYVSRYQKGISPNMILDKSETVLYHLFYVENCLEFLCDDLLVQLQTYIFESVTCFFSFIWLLETSFGTGLGVYTVGAVLCISYQETNIWSACWIQKGTA